MFFNHLSSRNDPLHKAHKEKITPKAECTDAIAKALQHAAPGTPGANLTHADNRGVSAATRTRRLAWAPASRAPLRPLLLLLPPSATPPAWTKPCVGSCV